MTIVRGREIRRARLAIVAAAAVCAGWVSAAPSPPADLDAIVERVGARVADYCRHAANLICVERSTVQPLQRNWTPDGMARIVESELRVEAGASDGSGVPDAMFVRDVRRVNGREPRERDKTARAGCTDPNPLSPEPLAFLLPAHRRDYRFTAIHEGRDKTRAALVIDFMTANRTSKPELVEDERKHDDCFDWTGPLATKGRLWVDAETFEVLRVERWLEGPVEIRVPWALQRRYNFDGWVVLERDDQTIRYKPVTFRDPDEIVLLPESIESLTMVRGGLQSIRRTETFSEYRRFLTHGRIVKQP